MLKLLKKEFCLSMHPMTMWMILLSVVILIPNYPYTSVFFYTLLGIFFTCLNGKENYDMYYSMMLPIPKEDIVKARYLFAVIIQMLQILCMIPIMIFRYFLIDETNGAGMEANIVLIGMGFIIYGIFNLVFYGAYFGNINSTGMAIIKTSGIIIAVVIIDVLSTYFVSFVKDKLDTLDPAFMKEKMIFLALAIVFYIISTWGSYKKSVADFIRYNI